MDVTYPSDNEYGIPRLRADREASHVHAPMLAWGTGGGRKAQNRGAWHFYTDDYRFEALWHHPEHVPATGCAAAVEPNWSLFDGSPLALAVWQTYRKRTVARDWQEAGVNILVDLNVPRRYAELNLMGVPRGWRAYATHGYSERLEDLVHEYGVACGHRGSRDVLFVVYGGGRAVSDLCGRMGWLHQEEQRTVARERKRSEGKVLMLPAPSPDLVLPCIDAELASANGIRR